MSGYNPDDEKPTVSRAIAAVSAQPSYPARQSQPDDGWGSKIFFIGIIIGLFAIAGMVGAKSLTISTPQPICNAPNVSLSCPAPVIMMNSTPSIYNSTCSPTLVCQQGNVTVVNATRSYDNATLTLLMNGTLPVNVTLAFSDNMNASITINDTLYNFTILMR